jgi:LacI family transcriptional regulator
MMAGIESELRNAGKHVIITTGHSEEEKEKAGIEFLISRNCDAIILHVEAVSDEYIIELCKKYPSIYLISRLVEGIHDRCISLNNELGGFLATQAIIEHGHTNIAYISGPQFKADSKERFAGHKKALAQHNITFNDNLFFEGDFRETGGKQGLKAFMANTNNFTALVCANDEMASGAITFAREQGLSLPNDLSIIGFDNIIFARHTYPKLTTIDNPVNLMGHMAAKLVLKNIYQQKKIVITHSFEPSLITRNSVIEKR